jgi:hypothetical protein
MARSLGASYWCPGRPAPVTAWPYHSRFPEPERVLRPAYPRALWAKRSTMPRTSGISDGRSAADQAQQLTALARRGGDQLAHLG